MLAHDGPLVLQLREAGIETEVSPLAVLRRSELSPAGIVGLGRRIAATTGLARGREVALVHSNTSVTLSGPLAARRAGVPHVWHVREIYPERIWPAYRRVLMSADSLPCVSGAVRKQFPDRSPATVLGDGVAILGHPPAPATPEAEARTVCVVLGRISPWKGQEVLLRAVAKVPEAVAVVAGDAWRGQEHREVELRNLATSLGIEDRVRFVGFVADPRSLYAASDIVVVPSTRPDPLPNAALEAAAAGCCVLASAHGGLSEIFRDGETGLLVAPGDPDALAAAIGRLSADAALRARLGSAAADDVRRRYAPELLLSRLQDLYDDLLTGRG